VFGWSCSPGTVFGATIYVPDDHPTIQGAIDASFNGDTVIVRPGSYVENIDFIGKAITVRSEQGAAMTTIDGSQVGTVVAFVSGEGLDSVLDGFTLTNGVGRYYAYWYCGGGIFCSGSSPTITSNTISANSAGREGGGIYCTSSSPTITNNTITGNQASSPYLGNGGGIYCHSSSPSIENNTISENAANATYSNGGGIICVASSSLTIENNIITENSANCGGGIHCDRSSPAIANNIITGNTTDWGSGISCDTSSPTITNNTVSGNSAGQGGGGIFCYNKSSATITNTILWNNHAPEGKEIWIGNSSYPSTITISYSDVEGAQSSVHVSTNCTLNWGAGMIDADPLFADTAGGDYHITWNSPCLDGGDNSVVTESFDFEGDPRIALGFVVDMGADEYWFHAYHSGRVIPGSFVI